jgi:hypothetical protein
MKECLKTIFSSVIEEVLKDDSQEEGSELGKLADGDNSNRATEIDGTLIVTQDKD